MGGRRVRSGCSVRAHRVESHAVGADRVQDRADEIRLPSGRLLCVDDLTSDAQDGVDREHQALVIVTVRAGLRCDGAVRADRAIARIYNGARAHPSEDQLAEVA